MTIQSMVVFCGSQSGKHPDYEKETLKLGEILAKKKIVVIYGGGNKGLMAAIANSALSNNGKVVGIIPKVLTESEHQHNGLTELFVVDNMHIRKQMLYEKSDAAVILPGGYGTLDELFEMLTWNQLKIHNKKIFFLNINGFYDHLLAHIDKMYDEGFLYSKPHEQMTMLKNAAELLDHI